MTPSSDHSTSRREFLKSSSAAVLVGAAAPFILPSRARAQYSADTIKVGLIGCGGRGSGAAKQALKADKNVVLTAIADAVPDRVKSGLNALKNDSEISTKVDVDEEHQFVGLDAYQKIINSGVDLVILATPPGFRPLHLKAAIAAGKHVFCEKPMAVDAPGVRSVLETVEEAKKKKLAIVAGFCWRYNYAERAVFEKIHEDAIGDVRAIYGTYLTGSLWSKPRKPEWTDLEWQIRNWLYFTWLSGDHITEQCVHTIDKMAWAMKDQPPKAAVGMGGRLVRTGSDEYGHIYDHFAITYEYPEDARAFIVCRQQPNCFNDNSDLILGTKGTAHVLGFRSPPRITGETTWRYSGPRPDMYQVEHDELFASIRAGKPLNDGVRMAHSTLLAIMGRMAAYTGERITWEDALNSKENLFPADLSWNQTLPIPPVAKPGQTKFS